MSLIKHQIDISKLIENNVKISVLFSSLIRKGLIVNDGSKLTTIGESLLSYLDNDDQIVLVKKQPKVEEFDLWWKTFPGTDNFTYKNRKFSGSRSLRQNKEDCRTKFNKILLEGDYTATQLIKALELDVEMKKEASIKQGVNKLTFMQNSLTYLNQRSFESFIELINQGVEIVETSKGGTDI